MKKKIIISVFLVITVSVLFLNTNFTYAGSLTAGAGSYNVGPKSVTLPKDSSTTTGTSKSKINTEYYKPSDLTTDDYDEAFNMTKTIVSAITTIGIAVAVIMIMVLGIRYMAGSVEERAEYKRTMIPVLVGAFLLFASATMVSIIYNFASNL